MHKADVGGEAWYLPHGLNNRGSYPDFETIATPPQAYSLLMMTFHKQNNNMEGRYREKCTFFSFYTKTVSNLLHSSVRNKFGELCPPAPRGVT